MGGNTSKLEGIIDNLRTRLKTATDDLAACQKENELLLRDLQEMDILKRQNADHRQNLGKLEESLRWHEETIKDHRDTIKKLQQESQSQRENLDYMNKEDMRHKTVISALQKQRDDLIEEKNEARRTIEENNRRIRELHSRVTHLDTLHDNIQDMLNRRMSKDSPEVQSLKRQEVIQSVKLHAGALSEMQFATKKVMHALGILKKLKGRKVDLVTVAPILSSLQNAMSSAADTSAVVEGNPVFSTKDVQRAQLLLSIASSGVADFVGETNAEDMDSATRKQLESIGKLARTVQEKTASHASGEDAQTAVNIFHSKVEHAVDSVASSGKTKNVRLSMILEDDELRGPLEDMVELEAGSKGVDSKIVADDDGNLSVMLSVTDSWTPWSNMGSSYSHSSSKSRMDWGPEGPADDYVPAGSRHYGNAAMFASTNRHGRERLHWAYED